jgi:hypothetical protein
MVYLIYYFLGIYLTIAEYALLPKRYSKNRYKIMLSIHLVFTVPASYGCAQTILKGNFINGQYYLMLGLITITLTLISLLLSGLIVNKIKSYN